MTIAHRTNADPGATAIRTGLVATAPSLHSLKLPLPVALYLITVALPIWVDIGSLALSLLRIYLLAMVVPLTIRLLAGAYGRLYATDFLYLLHVVWIVLALGINNPDRVLAQAGSVGVEFLGGYVLARAFVRTPEVFAALCRWLVIIVGATLPFALYETVTGNPVLVQLTERIPGLRSVEILQDDKRLGLERVQLLFAHPIHYGLFCSVAFSLAFVGLKGLTSTTWRYVSSALIAGCGFLALSSGAILSILLQFGLVIWAFVFAKVRHRWLLLVGLFVLGYVVIDILSNRSPTRVFMSYATFSSQTAYYRSLIFEWGMVNVRNHPIIGLGLNDWIRPEFMVSASIDNFWLLTAMRYGVPALVFLVIGYVWALILVGRRDFSGDAVLTHFRRAWMFTFMGLTFTLCTVHVWSTIYSFTFFLFGAGMWLIAASGDGGHLSSAVPVPPRDPTVPRYTRFPLRSGRGAGQPAPNLRHRRPE